MTNWIVTLFKAIGSVLFILTILSAAFSGMAVGGLLGAFGGPSEAASRAFMGFVVGGVVGLASATALYGLVFVAISTDAHAERIAYLQDRNNSLQSDTIEILKKILAELQSSSGNGLQSRSQDNVGLAARPQTARPQSQPKALTADDAAAKETRVSELEKKPIEELLNALRQFGYTIETLEGGTKTRLLRDGGMVLAESKRSLALLLLDRETQS